MLATNVQVLLFDLGGVLVECSDVQDVAPLLADPASETEIRERWAACPHTKAFCRGALSRQQFSERFVEAWGISLSPQLFTEEFRSWSRRLLPGALELVQLLRPRFRLAALSNSNELHWDRNTNDLGVTGLFEIAISSHQVGVCKPDPEIYRIALERLGVLPGAVMFFDDVDANVAMASALGMRAFQVTGVEGLNARLRQEGLL